MTDFSIKMGFYKIMGENPKDVSVTFDGETVGSLTVTSQDVDSPQYIEFTVNKDPGVYPCQISLTSNLFNGENVGICQMFVKAVDHTDWRDIRPNGPTNSDLSLAYDTSEMASSKTLVPFFFDEDRTIMIEVTPPHDPTIHKYVDRYGYTTLDEMIEFYDDQIANNSLELNQDKIDRMIEASPKLKSLRTILNDPTVRY